MTKKIPETVELRVAVVVNSDGTWSAYGNNTETDESRFEELRYHSDVESGAVFHLLTATVPLPKEFPVIKTTAGTTVTGTQLTQNLLKLRNALVEHDVDLRALLPDDVTDAIETLSDVADALPEPVEA